MQYRLGIDIGGTFTDFVAFDEANRELKAWKNLSTPQDPIEGVMTGLKTFGRDECAARRQRRSGRLSDDARLSRRAVHRSRQSPQSL
jgi:predicted NBD/HSP70 family sugar kinase